MEPKRNLASAREHLMAVADSYDAFVRNTRTGISAKEELAVRCGYMGIAEGLRIAADTLEIFYVQSGVDTAREKFEPCEQAIIRVCL